MLISRSNHFLWFSNNKHADVFWNTFRYHSYLLWSTSRKAASFFVICSHSENLPRFSMVLVFRILMGSFPAIGKSWETWLLILRSYYFYVFSSREKDAVLSGTFSDIFLCDVLCDVLWCFKCFTSKTFMEKYYFYFNFTKRNTPPWVFFHVFNYTNGTKSLNYQVRMNFKTTQLTFSWSKSIKTLEKGGKYVQKN